MNSWDKSPGDSLTIEHHPLCGVTYALTYRSLRRPFRGRIATSLLPAASAFCSAIAGPSPDIAGRPVSDSPPSPPSATPQQHVNAPIAIAHPRFRDLLDPLPKLCLLGSPTTVVIGRSLYWQGAASSTNVHLPFRPYVVDHRPLPGRLHIFRRMTSCSIALSSDRSATSFFSLAFSSSSWRSRFTSDGSKPPYTSPR
jgi:hypothetical protein